MRIANITPGILPIPSNGWGAIEKIIWEYHQNLLKLGYDSQIKYLNDVDGTEDIVHIHVANLANMAHELGIKYHFTFHDHHAYLHGEKSSLYEENLKAIKNAEKAFVPAKYLVKYFQGIPEYFSHGVNTDFFKPKEINKSSHKLLCVANNGFANDNSFDRKGFSYAIEAAQILDLPITIAGPSNNKNFFNHYNTTYEKLTIMYDLNEQELLDVYQNHTIFLSPSMLEAGHPNLTLLEAMSCGLPVIATFEKNNELSGLYKVERDVTEIVNGINHVINNYSDISKRCLITANNLSFKDLTKKLINNYIDVIKKRNNMKENLIRIYEETQINQVNILKKKNTVHYTFINGPKVEILGSDDAEYFVEFIDSDTNETVYSSNIKNNCWCKCSKEYYINWYIKVQKLNPLTSKYELFSEHKFDVTNKNVYIALDSSAIGDTIAWFPIVEEFRKKRNCNVTVSTFKNDWFKSEYPELNFVEPGQVVNNLYAMFTIGWYYNDKEINYMKIPINFRERNLQETATSVLGMEKMEIKPKLSFKKILQNDPIQGKYVVIAPHASAHAKYWNHPGGWQGVIDYLNNQGYKVVMITQEKLGDTWHDSKLGGTLTGVIDKTGDYPLSDRATDIMGAEFFIGVGSGLSWLSWALGTKTIMISGFSYPYTEFSDCIRVYNNNPSICSGCFNRHWLNPGDWEWCPDHKNTERMFECTKTISTQSVIDAVSQLIT